MNFNTKTSVCRADRFKPSGKWYDTFELDFEDHYKEWDLHKVIIHLLSEKFGPDWIDSHQGWHIVVLEPYSEFEHPQLVVL